MIPRRDFMGAVAALAGTRWDEEDYDIENADEWDPMNGSYSTGSFEPLYLNHSGEGPMARWLVEDEQLDESGVKVNYDSSDVWITMGGENEQMDTGCLAAFDTDQARELAAAIYQAAEELDRRTEAGED